MPPKKRQTQCFACDNSASSREHIPAECLFPETAGLRKNLITVPACANHNSARSEDDEFLRFVLTSLDGANLSGQYQFVKKILPAARRSSTKYSRYVEKATPVAMGHPTNRKVAIQFDRERFDNCIAHIMRGLHYYQYKEKWDAAITVFSPNLAEYKSAHQIGPNEDHLRMSNGAKQYLIREPILGENPDIFEFRIRRDRGEGLLIVALRFYRNFEVYGYSSPVVDAEVRKLAKG